LTVSNRKDRREVLQKHPTLYANLAVSYNEEIENLIENTQEELLKELNIDVGVMQNSVITLMEKEEKWAQYMFQLQIRMRQMFKETLISK